MMNLYANDSYLARACYVPFVLIWMIIRAYQSNHTSFSPSLLVRLDPRSLFTYSLILAFLSQFAHDFLLCYIRYRGGYDDDISQANSDDNTTTVSSSSSSTDDMTTQDLDSLYKAAWYAGAASMGLIITSLFALQAYWSLVMGQLSRRQFISTLEYRTYLVLAILILPIFPILEFISHTSTIQKELIPDLVFSSISILICLLSIRAQYGITTLINTPTRNTILPQTHGKLVFFQDLNLWLIINLFIWSASSLLLSVYSMFMVPNGFTGNNSSKFITDFLSANSTFGQFIVYIILISVIYPDFSIGPARNSLNSLKRTISSPYNVTKPKTFDTSNFDIGNFHELNNHTIVDIPHHDISPVHSDSGSSTSSLSEETSQTKSSYSATSTSHLRHKKKRSKNHKSRRTSNGRIEKSGDGFNRKRKNTEIMEMPTSKTPLTSTGSSVIEDALAQQIMIETQQDVLVEPAYMHAYINPHTPSPRYARSPGSRPTSTYTDLLLAPLPSPSSDFATTSNMGYHRSTGTGRNIQYKNSPILQQQGGHDTRQRSVRRARSTTPPIPSSPSRMNQQNRSQGQGNPTVPVHQQQFASPPHQQIYSPSPQSHPLQLAQFYTPSSQPSSRVVTQNTTKRNSLSGHGNINLSRSATRNSRSSDVASSMNRNSMASSNDGDGSEDEIIKSSERNRVRRVKRTSWYQQTGDHEETLSKVQQSDDDNDSRPFNPNPGNDVSYVEQLRGRHGGEHENRYERNVRRQESGSESNSSSRRMSRSSRQSTSETRDRDGYLHPSLHSSSNRNSGASYST